MSERQTWLLAYGLDRKQKRRPQYWSDGQSSRMGTKPT